MSDDCVFVQCGPASVTSGAVAGLYFIATCFKARILRYKEHKTC